MVSQKSFLKILPFLLLLQRTSFSWLPKPVISTTDVRQDIQLIVEVGLLVLWRVRALKFWYSIKMFRLKTVWSISRSNIAKGYKNVCRTCSSSSNSDKGKRKYATQAAAESFLNGSSSVYVEEMHNAWLKDPSSVHKVCISVYDLCSFRLNMPTFIPSVNDC